MSNEENHETPKIGKTVEEFNVLLGKYVDGSVKAAVLPTMMEIFEPIIPEKAEVISECYSQGEAYMAKHLKKGVRAIIKDSNLVERQNKLDKMLKDAEERDRVRIHLLPTPNQVSTGIVYKTKKAEIVRLQKILDDITEENYKLMNEIKRKDKEKREKESRIDSQINQFKKNVISVSSIPMEDLIGVMDELDLKNVEL